MDDRPQRRRHAADRPPEWAVSTGQGYRPSDPACACDRAREGAHFAKIPTFTTASVPDGPNGPFIDHQYLQLMSLTSHKPATVANNATAVAKAAKVFNIPALQTTAFAERRALLKEIQAVFPEQKPIDRTGLNSWGDKRVVDGVKKTGHKTLVMAGLWTEVCLKLAVLSVLGDGYDVYIIPDASGGGGEENHAMGIQRMAQAGAVPLCTLAYLSELQRDWAREATVPAVLKIVEEHGGGFGAVLRVGSGSCSACKEGSR